MCSNRNSETADLIEMRAAYASGDTARARQLEDAMGMAEYAPGRYILRSLLGTRGYEAETRGARAYETVRDAQHEADLEAAIRFYQAELSA
jgi:hypothetical protein